MKDFDLSIDPHLMTSSIARWQQIASGHLEVMAMRRKDAKNVEDAAELQDLDMNIDWMDFEAGQDACVLEKMVGQPTEVADQVGGLENLDTYHFAHIPTALEG